VDAVDLLILALRLVFVGLLYLFLFAVLRLALAGLRAPGPATGAGPSAPRAGRQQAGAPAGQALSLRVLEPGESTLRSGQILEIGDGTTLGRGERADLALGDTAVSAQHARLSREGRSWIVTDLGSTNGTRVNDSLVNGRASLGQGDVLMLGTVRLQVLPRGT
jgi:hypothetical protein